MENIELVLSDPRVVKALAHPLRAKLLALLDRREASPSQLSEELGVPLGTVSYHVRTLHEMGLLRLVGEARQRGAVEHYYTGVKWVIHEDAWKALPGALRGMVQQSFISQIGEDVSSSAPSGGFDEPYSLLNREILDLDEEGALQLAREVSGLMQRALAIESQSKERLENSGTGEASKVNLVLMLFGAPDKHAEQAGYAKSVPHQPQVPAG
jgi:DNA-binding transcriptional ArsR family regulator